MAGTVTAFDEHVGLGMVTGGDGTRYPFHCVEIAGGTRTIDIGTGVEFDVLHKLGRLEASRIHHASPT